MKHPNKLLGLTFLCGGLLLGTTPANAQYVTDEEWYDPSDWFDGDSYEIENEWEGYTYDNDFWDDYTWEDEFGYDYDYDSYDNTLWDEDEWSDDEWSDDEWSDDEWSESEGWTEYGYDADEEIWEEEDGLWEGDEEVGAYFASTPVYVVTFEPASDKAQKQGSKSREQGQKKGEFNKIRTFNGQVTAFRHEELPTQGGQKETITLAKVRLDNGNTVVMSLGEMDRLQRLDLKKGDQVKIAGATGRLAGQKIIVARQVQSKGNTVIVNDRVMQLDPQQQRAMREGDQQFAQRQQSQGQKSAQRQQSQGQKSSKHQGDKMRLSGEVASLHRVTVEGAKEDRTFVRIRTQDGQMATVDLGPQTSVQDLNLKQGDRIRIVGERRNLQGQTVLGADRIFVGVGV